MLDMFPTGPAFRIDSAMHASEPIVAWNMETRTLPGNRTLLGNIDGVTLYDERASTNDQLRKKGTQTVELPCPRASGILCRVSASAGRPVR